MLVKQIFLTFVICWPYLVLNCQDQPLDVQNKCSPKDIENWKIVMQEMEGISVADTRNPNLGPYPAKRFWSGNWYPLLPAKQTMCGKLRYYKIPWEDSQDWNLFLRPTGSYWQIFQDSLKYVENPPDVWNCDKDTPQSSDEHHPPNCYETEVGANKKFRSANPWFLPNNKSKLPIDSTVCGYAPFVNEKVHGSRPESHPVEAIWWRNNENSWLVLETQDASDRFAKQGSFSGAPSTWTPWAATPRVHDIDVGIEINPGILQKYVVTQVEGCAGNLWDGFPEVPPAVHTYTLNGQPVLEVTEQRGLRGFTVAPAVCSVTGNNRSFVGYLKISAAIGLGSEQGFQAIAVTKDGPSPAAEKCSDRPSAQLIPLPSTVTSIKVDGDDILVADTAVETSVVGGQVDNDRSVAFVRGDKRVEQKIEPLNQGSEGIKELPLTTGQQVQIGDEKIDTSLSIFPEVVREPQSTEYVMSHNATAAFVSAAGGKTLPSSAPIAGQIRHLSLIPRLQYVPLRDGNPEPEEESGFAASINESLYKRDKKAVSKMLRAPRFPVKLEWSFKAIDCGSFLEIACQVAKVVEIGRGKPGTDKIDRPYVDVKDAYDPLESEVEVYFPPQEHLFKLSVHLIASDPLTHTKRESSGDYWSVEIPLGKAIKDPAQFILDLAFSSVGLKSIQENMMVSERQEDNFSIMTNAPLRRKLMMESYTQQLVENGILTVPELTNLIEEAKSLATAAK